MLPRALTWKQYFNSGRHWVVVSSTGVVPPSVVGEIWLCYGVAVVEKNRKNQMR